MIIEPTVHFDWSISLGQLIVGAPTILVLGYVLRTYRAVWFFRIEHEMLMQYFAEQLGVRLDDLPTRRWARGKGSIQELNLETHKFREERKPKQKQRRETDEHDIR